MEPVPLLVILAFFAGSALVTELLRRLSLSLSWAIRLLVVLGGGLVAGGFLYGALVRH